MFCTVSCSLVFGSTELKHVTVQSFVFFHLTEELQTEALEPSRFFFIAFLSSIGVTHRVLKSSITLVTVEKNGNCGC